MHKGVFVSFEGGEGCGKSTQIRRLSKTLEEFGRRVLVFREPGGTLVGEHIRTILQHCKEAEGMTPESELLLFAASRAQLVREKILPAIHQGAVVLCDRFLDSTTVYQGVARRLPAATVRKINCFATGGLLPDLTFLLDLDWETARRRLQQRSEGAPTYDRMESQPAGFHKRVRKGYLKLASAHPTRILPIDALLPEEEIAGKILHHLRPLLDSNGTSSN